MHIGIAGAGLLGRLLALELSRAGHRVDVFDPASGPGPKAESGSDAAAWTAAGMLSPLAPRGEPWFVHHIGPTDQPHDPLGDVLGAGRDCDPPSVRGSVGVAGCVVGRAVPGARLHGAQLVPTSELWHAG